MSLLLCDSFLIVPQNTLDTKPDTRAIQIFKCYSLQPTENSIYPKMTLWGFSKDYLGDAAAGFETPKSVNKDVDVPLRHFLRWESMALGLSKCLCGEKTVIAKMNWALLLITEGISHLDLWKYANSMLICTSNYVPFNVRQSGTFTSYLTGKFIQCGASKMSRASAGKQWCVRTACCTVQVHVYWHPWVTASGVHFSPETTAQKGIFRWNVLKICGLCLSWKNKTAQEY